MLTVEKAYAYGFLRRVDATLSAKGNPVRLIPQTLYSSPHSATFLPDFPTVLKVGSSSQGVGKARIADKDAWVDALSVLSMTRFEYFSSEPMIRWAGDVRVQKIGPHLRAIRRERTGEQSSWKANSAIGIREVDVDVRPEWKDWIEEVRRSCLIVFLL